MICAVKGYRTLSVVQLVNIFVVVVFNLDSVFDGFRLLCAWLYLDAKDEATRRSLQKNGQFVGPKRYPRREGLRELVGVRVGVSNALAKLEQLKLVTRNGEQIVVTETPLSKTRPFLELVCGVDASGELKRSAMRPVPIPLEWLKAWATPSRSRVVSLLHVFYCAAGLSFKGRRIGNVQNAARFKLNRLIRLLPVPEARVKRARRRLIDEGRITDDNTYSQIRLNRLGHYFQVKLEWGCESERKTATVLIGNSGNAVPETIPQGERKCSQTIPPYKETRKASLIRNQKLSVAGASLKREGEDCARQQPDPHNIRFEDLHSIDSLHPLFKCFKALGWIGGGKLNFILFVAAALKCRELKFDPVTRKNDPVRVFRWIVQNLKWDRISNANEDRARKVVNEFEIRELEKRARDRSFRKSESSTLLKPLGACSEIPSPEYRTFVRRLAAESIRELQSKAIKVKCDMLKAA